MEHIFGGEVGGFAPAFDDDLAAFGIERDDDALAADGVGDVIRGTRVGAGSVKAAVPTMTRWAP